MFKLNIQISKAVVFGCLLLSNYSVMAENIISIKCTAGDFKCLDENLNVTYQKLKKTLRQNEANDLTKVQRLWIKYRDNLCEFESTFLTTKSWYSESEQGAEKLECLYRLTETRINELNRYLKFKQQTKTLSFNEMINAIDDFSVNGLDESSNQKMSAMFAWILHRHNLVKQYSRHDYEVIFKKFNNNVRWLDRSVISPRGAVFVAKNNSVGFVQDAVILFSGDAKVAHAKNSIIISTGSLKVSHSNNNIIIANKDIIIGHDGSVEYGSFIMTPEKVDISDATGSIIYAPKGVEISHASRVKCINSTKLTKKNICSEDIITDDFLD